MTLFYRTKRNRGRYIDNVQSVHHCSDRKHHGIDVIVHDDGSHQQIRTDYNLLIGRCWFR